MCVIKLFKKTIINDDNLMAPGSLFHAWATLYVKDLWPIDVLHV